MKTSFIAKIGSDEHAEFMLQKLQESGIDTSTIVQESKKTSQFSSIWVDTSKATRAIVNSNGSISPIVLKDFFLPTENMIDQLHSCRLLHVDGREWDVIKLIISAYKQKNPKTLVSIDTGNYRERTLELLGLVDVIIMPKRFPLAMFKNQQKEGEEFTLLELVKKTRDKFKNALAIIVTDGVSGSACSFCQNPAKSSSCENFPIYEQKAFRIKTYDTTGAGDTHAGAIIFGFLQYFENNPKHDYFFSNVQNILKFAAAAAAIKCRGIGNLELPSFEQVLKFIQENESKT